MMNFLSGDNEQSATSKLYRQLENSRVISWIRSKAYPGPMKMMANGTPQLSQNPQPCKSSIVKNTGNRNMWL